MTANALLSPSPDAALPLEAVPTDELFADLYAQLRRMARRELAMRGSGATIGATTLLHEAYLELAGRDGRMFPDRAHFMAYASRVMRGLIIDHVRRRKAAKRGGQFELTGLDTTLAGPVAEHLELERISHALDTLAASDAALAQVVDLKFFCGFTFAEIAAMHGISERTVQRRWEKARIYLHQALGGPGLD